MVIHYRRHMRVASMASMLFYLKWWLQPSVQWIERFLPLLLVVGAAIFLVGVPILGGGERGKDIARVVAVLSGLVLVLLGLPRYGLSDIRARLFAAGIVLIFLGISADYVVLRLSSSEETQSLGGRNIDRVTYLLSINDVYRIEGRDGGAGGGGLARLRALRAKLEEHHPVLLLHAGDVISPSLLGQMYYGKQMIDVLNELDGEPHDYDQHMVAVLGNHEFD